MKKLLASVAIALTLVAVKAQTPSDQKFLAFDVAAVKENKSGSTDNRLGGPPNRFTATNLTAFQLLITFAYSREDFEIESVPDWAKADHFDITAKADGDFPIGTPGSFGAQRAMLRSLLIDRLKVLPRTPHRSSSRFIMGMIQSCVNHTFSNSLRHPDVEKPSSPATPSMCA